MSAAGQIRSFGDVGSISALARFADSSGTDGDAAAVAPAMSII
jgi:hypothetical protein